MKRMCVVQVMQQAGAYVKEEVCRALIVLISNAPELHGYTARAMYRALKDSADQAELPLSLVTSTCWFLGEHARSCLAFLGDCQCSRSGTSVQTSDRRHPSSDCRLSLHLLREHSLTQCITRTDLIVQVSTGAQLHGQSALQP